MSGWHFKKYTNKVELYPKMQDVCVHLNFKNDSASRTARVQHQLERNTQQR